MFNNRLRPYRRLTLVAGCALAVCCLAGCEDPPEIKKYSAERDKPVIDYTRLAGYTVPDGWVRKTQNVEFSLMTFNIGEGKKNIVVTVSRMDRKGGMLLANLGRWRGKAGLAEASPNDILKDVRYLQVGGEKTPYVDYVPPSKSEADRLLGVIAERGPVAWIFKLSGPPEQVEGQKAAFEKFVESVRFGNNGANHE